MQGQIVPAAPGSHLVLPKVLWKLKGGALTTGRRRAACLGLASLAARHGPAALALALALGLSGGGGGLARHALDLLGCAPLLPLPPLLLALLLLQGRCVWWRAGGRVVS